ncbi:MAG: hypothetical protein J0M02_17920 [Planctomycetes bacterium]|nr:hypothetical protein [Planctomycetota bacterium]
MRRTSLAIIVIIAAILLPACQTRMPLSRTEASSAARNWCLRDGHAWGDPVEVVQPGAADEQGRTWWTVRFKAADGEHRLLVDTMSGWVKQAQ